MGHLNASVDNIERPLLTPDEKQRLKPPKKKGRGDRERIVAPGQMLIFVSGSYPILRIQMRYFFDPSFTMRAEIPPPTKLVSLNDNQILEQTPVKRPQHLINPPEAPLADLSHAEKAFLDGLEASEEYAEMEESFDAEESH